LRVGARSVVFFQIVLGNVVVNPMDIHLDVPNEFVLKEIAAFILQLRNIFESVAEAIKAALKICTSDVLAVQTFKSLFIILQRTKSFPKFRLPLLLLFPSFRKKLQCSRYVCSHKVDIVHTIGRSTRMQKSNRHIFKLYQNVIVIIIIDNNIIQFFIYI
jgi:hypothetical protein